MSRSLQAGLSEGAARFNQGLYWEAHHSWECGWTHLPHREKCHVQALIQACGVFIHIEKGRDSAAASLCRSAVEKLRQGAGAFTKVEIDGLAGVLADLRARFDAGDRPDELLMGRIRALRARVMERPCHG